VNIAASTPRWLTSAELAAWVPFAELMFRLPAALDAQLQRDAGMSHFEYMVLAVLSAADDHALRMSELAEMAGGSQSRLSHVVSRLERRGWVRREPCQEDGRFTNAVLTGAGMDKLAQTAPGHVTRVRELVVDALSDGQFLALGEISERVLERLPR
jgi:DNA-binding MarR family transcriptional regulator